MGDLHVTSPMMSGADVGTVQQQLSAAGYSVGNIDGVYGPTTAAAVRAFQADHGLDSDGVVGPETLAALENPADAKPAQPSALGLAAVAFGMKYVGVKEEPPSSNKTEFGAWFGVDGVAWCNIFVSYCFAVGANYVIADAFPGGKGAGIYPGKGCSYVPTTEAWLRATGMWIGRVAPLPGDVAIYNWDGGEPDHIGIVTKYLGGGDFEALEGNTAVGADSDGGEVMVRKRNLTQVDGFGRVTA